MMTTQIATSSAQSEAGLSPGAETSSARVRLVAQETELAPAEIGGTYSNIDAAAVSDSGEVAFSASLSDSTVSSAILLKSGLDTRVLLRSGEQAPGGGTYKKFGELDISFFRLGTVEEGKGTFLIFRAELEGGPAPEGVFLWTPDEVKVVALAGGKSPLGDTYRSFAQLTVVALNNNFGLRPLWALTAMTEDGKKTIILYPAFGDPIQALTTGQVLGDNKVEDFVISPMGAMAISCVADMRARKGGKRFKEVITVTEDSVYWGGLKDKRQFEGLGRVKRISAPPSIGLQEGFVALEFKSGVSAIVAKNVVREAVIIARTGDPSNSLPGETIQKFGPPIANVNFPGAQDLAVVSTVLLSGGQSAVWALTSKEEDRTARTGLLLVEGDTSIDGQNFSLRAFSLIKVSNTGALLLRARVADGDATREGLFLVDGLFD